MVVKWKEKSIFVAKLYHNGRIDTATRQLQKIAKLPKGRCDILHNVLFCGAFSEEE